MVAACTTRNSGLRPTFDIIVASTFPEKWDGFLAKMAKPNVGAAAPPTPQLLQEPDVEA
jgi:hypothetical protein